MKKVKILAALLALFLSSSAIMAQQNNTGENNSGSFYSFYGVGYPVDLSSVQERATGIFGVSLDNTQSSSLQNPAIWGKNVLTTASSGFRLSRYLASDQNTNSTNALLEAGFLQIVLPLSKQKLGLSASLYPSTRSSYRVFNLQTAFPGPEDTLNYVSDNQGIGGVNKLEFGLGWSINRNLSVGYAPSFVFLSKTNDEFLYFDTNNISTVNVRDEITGTGIGHRFGLLFTKERLFNKKDKISFGAAVTFPINFEVEQRAKTNKTVGITEQEVQIGTTKKGNLKLPLELNTGLTYYPSSFVNLSLEGQMQRWSEFEYELDSSSEQVMSDRYRIGLGGQFHPYRFGSTRFLSKFKYSAGVSYDTGHLTINNQDIETLWLSTGLGILSPRRSQSTVDVSFRYGFRGTSANNLVKEKIWAINFSINLAELMFLRRKLK